MEYKVYNVYLTSPFIESERYTGMHMNDCICIGKEEFQKLDKKYGENTLIVFHVNYIICNIKEDRMITIKGIKDLMEKKSAKEYYGKAINKMLICLNRRSCKKIEKSVKKEN